MQDESSYIIPYQVITGNYNLTIIFSAVTDIIPYQVITGNYNIIVGESLY